MAWGRFKRASNLASLQTSQMGICEGELGTSQRSPAVLAKPENHRYVPQYKREEQGNDSFIKALSPQTWLPSHRPT